MDPNAGYDEQALIFSEKGRARGLLDLLAQAKVNIRQSVAPKLLQEEKLFLEKINGKELERTRLFNCKASKEDINKIAKDLENLLSSYKEIQTEIHRKSPQYANLTRFYKLLLSSQTTKPSIALSETQLALWREKYPPYVWAAFVIQGK